MTSTPSSNELPDDVDTALLHGEYEWRKAAIDGVNQAVLDHSLLDAV
ncbi:hypothetical protein IMZ48_08270 [Candidatus Bathyarchaeota archaeon]|nr:hypothetical protein [Candidatus Bathyarchaeota archaeon]